MSDNPKVTVLMPVYNGEIYLREAMDSILNQTFTDFEFLIINDGSTDKSADIIRSYRDARIRLVENEKNLGLIATLNKGIDLSRGEYIARMDCDDISLPERLGTQVEFMDRNNSIGISGTFAKAVGDESSFLYEYPVEFDKAKCVNLFTNAFAHPTVIFRKDVLVENGLKYDPAFIHAEDFDLWVRASRATLMSNIPETLVLYRIHHNQISTNFLQLQKETTRKIYQYQIEGLGISPTPTELDTHFSIAFLEDFPLIQAVKDAYAWLDKLKQANATSKEYPEPAFTDMLSEYWMGICNRSIKLGYQMIPVFLRSQLRKESICSLQAIKFLVNCIRN
jgi:glycosyltransferase involved in cell wall biosynthesis